MVNINTIYIFQPMGLNYKRKRVNNVFKVFVFLKYLKLFFIFSILLGSFFYIKSADAHPYISNPGTLLDGFENANDWTLSGTGATKENDTSIFKFGNQSVKLNATGGNSATLLKPGLTLDLSTGDGFPLWFYVSDETKLGTMTLLVTSTTNFSKYFTVDFLASSVSWYTGWNIASSDYYVVMSNSGKLTKSASSIRYKKDVREYEYDINKISQLKPVRFKWNEKTASPDKEDFGLIAEEVYKVFPELVTLNQDRQPEAVDYPKLGVILLKATQELNTKIERLENEIKSLKSDYETRLKKLEQK